MDSVRTRTAVRLLHLLPRERITRAVGHLTQAQVPQSVLRPVLKLYSRAYNVDLNEAVLPAEGFATFNEFFTRRLREGMRPIDSDPDALISPADGRLDDGGPIENDTTFLVKGQRYDTASLLDSTEEADRFSGGSFCVVYLSPRDYHRVHTPAEGVVERVRHVPGTLYPVNRMGVEHVPLLFARNERVVIWLRSPTFGRIAVVMVGAMIVGKISLTVPAPQRPRIGGLPTERRFDEHDAPTLARGAELGAFLLGSTVVLLMEPDRSAPLALTRSLLGSQVRVGQSIARRSTR